MASSLQSQLQMLLSNNDICGDLSTSYLRSILESSYAFGSAAGIVWGYISDRIGRRPVTLVGLFSMFLCCLSMGFATDLTTCAIFRFIAGISSSTVVVTALTMFGDLSATPAERTKYVSGTALIALCGSVGPIIQRMVIGNVDDSGAVWQKFPMLSSQIACGSLVLLIAITAAIMLKEVSCSSIREIPNTKKPLQTLPLQSTNTESHIDMESEKTGFLTVADPEEPTTICVVDFARPEPISISQFMQAPSFLVLLCSFCLLSLHASTFDVLLPHLGHSSTQRGGMGIPCSWLGFIDVVLRGVAGLAILRVVPQAVEKFGLLKPYRSMSMLFPAVYITIPLLALIVACSTTLTGLVSTAAILIKHTLTGGASVLVTILVLNTTPDAFSAGTVVGLMQVASLFKALAVAVSGASFYLSSDFSVSTTNFALWTILALFGTVGAALAWFARERPSVERDFPSEVLCWETCFDAERNGDGCGHYTDA